MVIEHVGEPDIDIGVVAVANGPTGRGIEVVDVPAGPMTGAMQEEPVQEGNGSRAERSKRKDGRSLTPGASIEDR